jgi:plastocyanin
MRRIVILFAAAVTGLALASSAATMPAATKLKGTVGPGFTITLKKGTAKVKTLKAGKYTIAISDKSDIHNFHLKGPGLNKMTSVGFKGSKTWNVTLKKGTYRYVCDPHASQMKGSFKVT